MFFVLLHYFRRLKENCEDVDGFSTGARLVAHDDNQNQHVKGQGVCNQWLIFNAVLYIFSAFFFSVWQYYLEHFSVDLNLKNWIKKSFDFGC